MKRRLPTLMAGLSLIVCIGLSTLWIGGNDGASFGRRGGRFWTFWAGDGWIGALVADRWPGHQPLHWTHGLDNFQKEVPPVMVHAVAGTWIHAWEMPLARVTWGVAVTHLNLQGNASIPGRGYRFNHPSAPIIFCNCSFPTWMPVALSAFLPIASCVTRTSRFLSPRRGTVQLGSVPPQDEGSKLSAHEHVSVR